MTKNEYIASIMLEAAELLKEDNCDSLNENTLAATGLIGILSVAYIGGIVYMVKSGIDKYKKEKEKEKKLKHQKEREKEEEEEKRLEKLRKQAKIRYVNNTFRKNQFIESISKKTMTINNDDELREYILKDIRKLINACNKSTKVKKELKESITKFYNKCGYDESESDFNGLCVDDQGDYIKIINGNQEDCRALSWFIDELADVIDEKWGVGIGTGDGDEGSIYLW